MDSVLPLRCPTCGQDGARVYIVSQTVLTVRCAHCTHVWCVDMKLLPDSVRESLGSRA